MIKKVIITNYVGDTLDIDLASPWNTGLAILDIDGIADLKANINTTNVATNDGSLYNSARTESRNIVFKFKPLPSSTGSIEPNRLKIYKFFPTKREVHLRFITENRDVDIDGYVESSETDVFESFVQSQVSVLCPFPYFEDHVQQLINFSGISPNFEFPFGGVGDHHETTTDMVLSEILNDQVRLITYNGDVDNGMKITIHAIGAASNIVVYNIDTNEQIGINYTMEALDDIIITTYKNKKSAKLLRNGIYTNILNYVDKNADWFELRKGNNIVGYAATEGVENLQFNIQTAILYEGI